MDVINLAQQLIQKKSLTPNDAGCQEIIITLLKQHGFSITELPFGEVKNLWATHGSSGPTMVFVGHTDVVDPGNLEKWQYNPFEAVIEDNILHGRGSADMKGALAAMICAACEFINKNPSHSGTIAFLITSDEEGKAQDGTKKVVEYLKTNNIKIDYCVIGEASSEETLGDQIRIGRRGSLHADITIIGTQGHVAYPESANNAIHETITKLSSLVKQQWDQGNEHFPATTMQITSIKSGVADNVIPGECKIHINFRYCPESTEQSLKKQIEGLLENVDHSVDWRLSGKPFLTKPGKLINTAEKAIQDTQNITPKLSTGGGTSDGRFIATTGCEVIELGVINKTIHKTNECVAVDGLNKLQLIYIAILNDMLTNVN